MGFLRIYCDSCGGQWEIYHRDIHNADVRQCPHCYAKIDRQTWARVIVPAFGEMLDAERELFKDHADHRPLFTVDFVSNAVYTNAKRRDRGDDDADDDY